MSGPSTKPSERISGLEVGQAERQAAAGERLAGLSEADRTWYQGLIEKGLQLFAPGIEFYKGIASGDRTKMAAAAAPITSEISRGAKTATERIYSEVPRGAGQEFGLATVPREQAGAVARAMGETYLSAFDKLTAYGQGVASVGQGVGEYSLAEMAGGLRAGEAASTSLRGAGMTQQSIMEAQAKEKQATMGFLGAGVEAAGRMGAAKISDTRLKRNIQAFMPGREAIARMEPMTFEFTGDGGTVMGETGVSAMAQDLRDILPEAVVQGPDGYLRIKLDYVLWTLVNAVRELSEEVGRRGR